MVTSGTVGGAAWFTDRSVSVTVLPGHTATDDSDGRSAPANVTNVLTITNVSISDNGRGYFCAQGVPNFNLIASNISFLTVLGKLVIFINY